MDQPAARPELLHRLEREHARLAAVLDQLTPAQSIETGVIGAWSVKDLLAHLIAHEQRALEEIAYALRGERVQIDHAAIDSCNEEAVAASGDQPFDAVRAAWEASYRQVVEMVVSLPGAAFDPSGPVAAALDDSIDGALANNTYEHYAEHRHEIVATLRTMAS